MAVLGKTDWYSAEKKIILTIALAILIASVSVFAILYLMMSHALQEDIRARARVVNAYAESHLNLEGFVHINTLKDMRRDTYQDMQSMLDNIRQIANVRYLYTAKFNDRGQPMYLVDGLPPNSSDFRSPGDLIEQDIVPMLNRCLSGELIESDGVLNTVCPPIPLARRSPSGPWLWSSTLTSSTKASFGPCCTAGRWPW